MSGISKDAKEIQDSVRKALKARAFSSDTLFKVGQKMLLHETWGDFIGAVVKVIKVRDEHFKWVVIEGSGKWGGSGSVVGLSEWDSKPERFAPISDNAVKGME